MEARRLTDAEIGSIMGRLNFDKLGGIIPAVTVDEHGRVLMLAFMNREALEKTLRTGMMHYWSRSRGRLWMKGEESKHYQHVMGAYADCDDDSLLFKVRQDGNACHTGRGSCFYKPLLEYKTGADVIRELEDVVDERMISPKEGSYTSKIIAAGLKEAAKKTGEEGVEAGIAALVEDEDRTASEAADLIYHLILLLKMKGIGMKQVYEELSRRRK